jgi:hypothetical protein
MLTAVLERRKDDGGMMGLEKFSEYGSSNGDWRSLQAKAFKHKAHGWQPRRSLRVARRSG